MDIEILATPKDITAKRLKEKAAVIFDVLRATSTIVTALANGCRAVIPAKEIAEAKRIEGELKSKDVLLGGERGGERAPGFSHGNSPLEYPQAVVAGKVLVLTTTNGTRAIRPAAKGAAVLLIGSLLNARAVAGRLWELQNDVVLVCAGTNGNFSLEDALAAGVVVKEILSLAGGQNKIGCREGDPENLRRSGPATEAGPGNPPVILSDLATAVYRLALWYGDNLLPAFYDSRHGQRLLRLGLAGDLEHCSRLNLYDLVPVYRQGIITVP